MPRLKKPASEKLLDSINTPVTRPLKRRVLDLAKKRGVPPTKLTREWIERAAGEADSKQAAAPTG